MSVGIPMELMTMLGSSILGGVMSLWGQSMKAKRETHAMWMEKAGVTNAAVEKARRYGAGTGFQFTRRIIALTAVAAIIVWPKVAAVVFPELDVTVGWTEWNPGFLFFEGSEETRWRTMKGLVVTPLDTHLMSAIIGLYFGASVVKNS